MKLVILLCVALVTAGCQGVRVEDTAAWVGRPVNDLDLHPVFLTMQLVKTTAADGTEIRNYVNSGTSLECYGGGALFGTSASTAMFSDFSNCTSRKGACNNIFYIKKGVVTEYLPTGSGGARCFTDETLRPRLHSWFNAQN